MSRLISRKKQKYDRVLPFGDYMIDRWEKAHMLGFGEGSSIYDSSHVFGDVKVGKNCWIGPFTILDGSGGGLVIGDNTHISAGAQIYTHDTVERAVAGDEIKKGPVHIGSNCYLGPNAVVSLGIHIGNFVTIGANSFVNMDIPSHSKAFGNPARIADSAK